MPIVAHAPARILLLFCALLAVSGLGFALRATSSVAVLRSDGIEFLAPGDSYYHMRRIVHSAARFPDVLSLDPYVNPPHGGEIVWPPAFDLGIAGLARMLVDGNDARAVERVAVWVPAALGAATVLTVGVASAWAFSPAVGVSAALLLAVLPAHLLRSQMGLVDHHVAVAFWAVLLLFAAFGVARRDARGVAPPLLLGASFAGAILTWPGALLHVATLEAVLIAWALASETRATATRRARALAVAHGITAALIFPAAWGVRWTEYGAWSPLVLTSFQPLFFAAAGASLLAASASWSLRVFGANVLSRLGSAAALAAIGVGVALVFIPGLLDALAYGAGWFTKQEAFQEDVAELLPYSLRDALTQFSILIVPFAAVWGWLAARTLRAGIASPRGGERALLLAYSAVFFGLAMLQRRFGNSLSVIFVLFWAWAWVELRPWLSERLAARGLGRRALAGVALALGLVVAASLLGFHGQRLAEWSAARRDPLAAQRGTLPVRHQLVDRAAVWLGRESPPTRGWLDPAQRPEYAVLTSWDTGHAVRYRAQRPVTMDNFGVYGGRENYETAWRYFESEDEQAADALLDGLGVRYVVADGQGAGTYRRYGPKTMTARLATAFGSAMEASDPEGGPPIVVPALGRHRLIHHLKPGSGASLVGDRESDWAVGVWERVPGARVVGEARPGEWVECRLALQAPAGRRHLYRSRARADAGGRYELRLPYPTDRAFSASIRAGRRYRCFAHGQAATLQVEEATIRAGAAMAGPRFAKPVDGS